MTKKLRRHVLLVLIASVDSSVWANNEELLSLSRVEDFQCSIRCSLTLKDASGDTSKSVDEKYRYIALVDAIANYHQVDRALLHAIVSVESRYNPKARSPSGAIGLMQLMPSTARRYGIVNAFDPEENLHGGTKYLIYLLQLFKNDIRVALAAYHAGEYAVAKQRNKIPKIKSTINFVSKVMNRYQSLRRE